MTVKVNTMVEKVEKVVVEEKEVTTYDLIGLTATELNIIEALIVGVVDWTTSANPRTMQDLYEVISKISPSKPAFHVVSGADGFKKLVQFA
jgi:hypothetical protein